MQKLKFSISPAMFVLLTCMIATTPPRQLISCILAASVHELGHIVAGKALCINLSHMRLDILGARLTTTGRLCSYPALVGLCIAGPLSNILCFALLHPLIDTSEWVQEFCMASISLGIINLIPIRGFDGGRILHGLLSLALPVSAVEKISSILGFFSLLCIWLLSVWLLLRTGTSLTLFVFSCCLFAMLFV